MLICFLMERVQREKHLQTIHDLHSGLDFLIGYIQGRQKIVRAMAKERDDLKSLINNVALQTQAYVRKGYV